MKTNEVESLTGLSKRTIMYYEKEGLIDPLRDENNYRKFNDKDIQVLQLIKLLRSMNISIDDIKLVITKQLPFQECLEIQSEFIESSYKELKEAKEMVKKYKEKQLPIIPALKDIESITFKTKLGYRRTTNSVTLGRVLTKKYLIRKLIFFFLGSLFFGCLTGFIIGHNDGNGVNIYVTILTFIGIFVFRILLLAAGLGNMGFLASLMGTSAYQNNPTYFIEFIETGIKYYIKGSILKQLKYFKALLSNQDGLTYYAYEAIDKVIVEHKFRYIGISGSPLSQEITTPDFTFIFNDGVKYYLYNPITLDHDLEFVAHILKNKVANIDDKDNTLDKLINKNK